MNRIIIILIIVMVATGAAAIHEYIKIDKKIKDNNKMVLDNEIILKKNKRTFILLNEQITDLNKITDLQEENIVELRGFNTTQHDLLTELVEQLAYEKDLIKQLEGKLLGR